MFSSTPWGDRQSVSEGENDVNLFYLDDHLRESKSYLDRIRIDDLWKFCHQRLDEPPRNLQVLFCS